MEENEIEDFVNLMLEDFLFEELLEQFNITPYEAFLTLFEAGMIDESLLKSLMKKI